MLHLNNFSACQNVLSCYHVVSIYVCKNVIWVTVHRVQKSRLQKCLTLGKTSSRRCLYARTPVFCAFTCNKNLKCDGLRLGIAHRCLRQCHPGPYPSCSQKFESYCLCKRSRKNIPCLLMNAPVLYHKHFFYKNSAKHKNALPIASHVTCLSFSAWQCNRRCKLILDCGKHQCKKKCCTKLKHQCFTVCTRLLAVACTFAIGLVIRADAIRQLCDHDSNVSGPSMSSNNLDSSKLSLPCF
ncbi:eukaryotic translation initiation factor 2C 2 [Trichinella spiralis]|uniref:eukaryotic translation initiation factor 2C 2 n=1 Tax=Trichinella spiralis TaxID=6334 RepID=UPI0001EFE01B|nr:eukaryotic translation initiation factor 2C 2 [Trichinella spiralis]